VALGVWLAGFGFVFEAGALEVPGEGFVTVFCGTALVVFAVALGLTVDGLGFEFAGVLLEFELAGLELVALELAALELAALEFEAPDGTRLIGVTATGGFGVAGVVGLV
jgi:hypothetical protein